VLLVQIHVGECLIDLGIDLSMIHICLGIPATLMRRCQQDISIRIAKPLERSLAFAFNAMLNADGLAVIEVLL
jgi:hypothetical protein